MLWHCWGREVQLNHIDSLLLPKDGQTALHFAVWCGYKEILEEIWCWRRTGRTGALLIIIQFWSPRKQWESLTGDWGVVKEDSDGISLEAVADCAVAVYHTIADASAYCIALRSGFERHIFFLLSSRKEVVPWCCVWWKNCIDCYQSHWSLTV